MAKKRRRQFFGMRLDNLDRPIWWDDLGTAIRVVGLVLSGNDNSFVLFLPGMKAGTPTAPRSQYLELGVEEWAAVLQQLNNPEYWIGIESCVAKEIVRKAQYQIGTAFQWQVYRRDGYACLYCGRAGGVDGVTLSVDHVLPVEMDGQDHMYNLAACCRDCNGRKGNRHPQEWCESIGIDYGDLLIYLHGGMESPAWL